MYVRKFVDTVCIVCMMYLSTRVCMYACMHKFSYIHVCSYVRKYMFVCEMDACYVCMYVCVIAVRYAVALRGIRSLVLYLSAADDCVCLRWADHARQLHFQSGL